MMGDYAELTKEIVEKINQMDLGKKVEALNAVRKALHDISPFNKEPVDCVQWVLSDDVEANDYNPNSVAPPEMELLRLSISADGYTQPVVGFDRGNQIEVVDGFHRHRVGRECADVAERIHGYLPVAVIRSDREGRSDRIASTIRHNRARGKHSVSHMSDIVVELKRRNWSNDRISRELGMDADEILRLCQVTGLADLFSDEDFSEAWEVKGSVDADDFEELSDDISQYGKEVDGYRTVNTNDPDRIFHKWDLWECYKAGFYASSMDGMDKETALLAYRDFLADTAGFADVLEHVIVEWKYSCEHYLTNIAMNRIAWLGQASACYALGLPAVFRSGFSLLEQSQQEAANAVALEYLNKWLIANGRPLADLDNAAPDRQTTIY